MKKRYIFLAVLGLILGYTAKTNYWFEDERDVYFPITKEQLRARVRSKLSEKNAANSNQSTQNIQTVVAPKDESGLVDISSLSRSLLFNEIYNNKILTNKNHQNAYFQMIKIRLQNKYPPSSATAHAGQYEREVADRLGLLRAMSHFWKNPSDVPSVEQREIKKFFHDIAKNKDENIMVRRQAYKNWLVFGDSPTRYDKTRLAASTDSRLLHLVSFSDEQLIESLTESAD